MCSSIPQDDTPRVWKGTRGGVHEKKGRPSTRVILLMKRTDRIFNQLRCEKLHPIHFKKMGSHSTHIQLVLPRLILKNHQQSFLQKFGLIQFQPGSFQGSKFQTLSSSSNRSSGFFLWTKLCSLGATKFLLSKSPLNLPRETVKSLPPNFSLEFKLPLEHSDILRFSALPPP